MTTPTIAEPETILPHIEDDETLRGNEIRKKVFTVRKTTTTREALKIVVMQTLNKKGKVALPTISLIGVFPTYIESARFCIDFGGFLIAAGILALEWSLYVDSTRR